MERPEPSDLFPTDEDLVDQPDPESEAVDKGEFEFKNEMLCEYPENVWIDMEGNVVDPPQPPAEPPKKVKDLSLLNLKVSDETLRQMREAADRYASSMIHGYNYVPLRRPIYDPIPITNDPLNGVNEWDLSNKYKYYDINKLSGGRMGLIYRPMNPYMDVEEEYEDDKEYEDEEDARYIINLFHRVDLLNTTIYEDHIELDFADRSSITILKSDIERFGILEEELFDMGRNGKVDKFGSRIGSESSRINAQISATPKSLGELCTETGLTDKRVKRHLLKLLRERRIVKSKVGSRTYYEQSELANAEAIPVSALNNGNEALKWKNHAEIKQKEIDECHTIIDDLEQQQKDLKQKIEDLKKNKPLVITIKRLDGSTKKITKHRHAAYEEIITLINMRMNIFLPGPSGCGKSTLMKQVARDIKMNFYSITCSAGMSEGQLLGRLLPIGAGGKFEYLMADFVKAYEEGGIFLADEIDAADPNTLLVINSALSNGYLIVPNRSNKSHVKRHKDFVFAAAANTYGRGADRLYVGRNSLDESTLDRFRIGTVPMDYDQRLEEQLCPDDDLRNRLLKYREATQRNRLERIVSTRFMAEAYLMKKEAKVSDFWIDKKLFSGWSKDEVIKVYGTTIEDKEKEMA